MPPSIDYERFRHTLAQALGRTVTAGDSPLGTLWTHATDRQLSGWERRRVDVTRLVSAYADYTSKNEWHTAYLDWMFLDAMLYGVIFDLIDHIHDDVLKPDDTGDFLPPVQRAFANSSDAKRAHPLWLDMKLTVMLTCFRWLPTLLLLALGIGCFFVGWLPYWINHGRDPSDIGEGWPAAGWTILGLLAARRVYRIVRWIARSGVRRRAWTMVNRLTDAYALLGAQAVPTRELRRVIERARDLFGRSAILGGNFWAVLDDVCARHPVNLISRQR
jgi:hypothetical protein